MSYAQTRILVVDDLGLARERVRQSLIKLGFAPDHIQEAANGREALDKLQAAAAARLPFAAVLSDWNMPEMTGVELLRACRGAPDLSRVKFMIVSSEGESNSVVEAFEAGTDDYAVKPIGIDDLTAKLKKMLG